MSLRRIIAKVDRAVVRRPVRIVTLLFAVSVLGLFLCYVFGGRISTTSTEFLPMRFSSVDESHNIYRSAVKEEIKAPATQGNKKRTRNQSHLNTVDFLATVHTPILSERVAPVIVWKKLPRDTHTSINTISKNMMRKKTQTIKRQFHKRLKPQDKRQRKTTRTTKLPTRMLQSQATTRLLLVTERNMNTSTVINVTSMVLNFLPVKKEEKRGFLSDHKGVGRHPKQTIRQEPSATTRNPTQHLQFRHTTGAPSVGRHRNTPNMLERSQGVMPTSTPVLEIPFTSKQLHKEEHRVGMTHRHQDLNRRHEPTVREGTLKIPLSVQSTSEASAVLEIPFTSKQLHEEEKRARMTPRHQDLLIRRHKPTVRTLTMTLSGSRKCQRAVFNNTLLIIIFNFPFYDSIPLLLSFYKGAFPHIMICGSEHSNKYKIFVVNIEKGYFGYECAAQAMRLHRRKFNGFFYINDDMIVNWWNFVNFDKSKIWFGAPWLSKAGVAATYRGNKFISSKLEWYWWNTTMGKIAFERAFREIKILKRRTVNHWNVTKAFKILEKNGKGSINCFKGLSDIFYIPVRFANTFSHMSRIFVRHRVFLEIAVPMIVSMLDERSNNIHLTGVYLNCRTNISDCRPVIIARYNPQVAFIHPFKLHSGDLFEAANKNILQNWAQPISQALTTC